MRPGWTYIIANKYVTVLYTGATNNISRRIWEHRTKQNPKSFSARYNIYKLVYCEFCDDVRDAFEWERKIKGKSWKNKCKLIEKDNPEWIDLAEDWFK
jgi:putative endonuclease